MVNNRSIHFAWVVLGVCFVNLFINYSIRLGYGVALPEMIKELGFSRTAGGSIFNAYFLFYVTLTPLAGYLTDRIGARRIITICAFILGVGTLLMGTIQSFWMACLSFAIAGIGSTGMWTPVITVVQRWFAPHRRGLALGILSTGYGLGFAAVGAVFPWVVNNYSWRYSWYFLGVAALVLVLANGLFLRSDPISAGYSPWGSNQGANPDLQTEKNDQKGAFFSHVFKDRIFWLIGISYFAISYSVYGLTTFMVDYAKYQMGLPLEKASFLATIHGICQVVGVLTILPLSDYLGRKRTIIIYHSFITAGFVGILLSGNSLGLLYVFVGLLAVFFGATFPIYGACAGDFFPKEVMGTVIGAWTPFYGVGAISVHWVSGILRDTTGSYDYPFMIDTVMAALGVLFMCLVRQTQR